MRRLVAILVPLFVLLGPAAHAAGDPPAGPPDALRREALAAMASDNLTVRRSAYEVLAEVGQGEDLPILHAALYDADAPIRKLAENAIWRVWSRSGDPQVDRLYQVGMEQLERGLLRSAVETFTRTIEVRPQFTEAWNKRALVHFLLHEDDSSIADCDEVLKRNPRHFGALSGYGQLMLRKGEPERALTYFERGLDINPNMDAVRMMVDQLKELLQRQQDRLI
jgi:tetratricopeptide (TPR) repeat protein